MLKIFITCFWLMVGYLVLGYYNPSSLLSPIYDKRVTFYILPQGWGFFTKSPLEPILELYKVEGDSLHQNILYNNGSLSNLFGVSKKARYNMVEVATLAAMTKKSKWSKGVGTLSLADTSKTYETLTIPRNAFKVITPGTYVFHKYVPTPFAWSQNDQKKYRPFETLRVLVE